MSAKVFFLIYSIFQSQLPTLSLTCLCVFVSQWFNLYRTQLLRGAADSWHPCLVHKGYQWQQGGKEFRTCPNRFLPSSLLCCTSDRDASCWNFSSCPCECQMLSEHMVFFFPWWFWCSTGFSCRWYKPLLSMQLSASGLKHYFSLQSFCSYQVIAQVFVLFINTIKNDFSGHAIFFFSPTND
jgi:hypothetical protein